MTNQEKLKRLEEATTRLALKVQQLEDRKAQQRVIPVSTLLESELERAETILAAKEIVKKLQDMAEDLAKIQVEDLMPLSDSMKLNFSSEQAEHFSHAADEHLGNCMSVIREAKDSINNTILSLEGKISDEDVHEPFNDMTMADDGEDELEDLPDAGNLDKDAEDEELELEDPFAGSEAASGPEEEPLGRAKKVTESRSKKKDSSSLKR